MTLQITRVDRFIEQLGRLAEGEGLPRTAGRLMGLLIISGTPLDIDAIAARLKVSRASVSTNSRLLQQLAIAQLVSQPGSRRDYLQISGDSCSSLLGLGLKRMRSMCAAVRELRLSISGAHFGTMHGRLQHMEKFYETAIAQLQIVLGDWSERQFEVSSVLANNGGPRASIRPGASVSTRKRRSHVRE